MIRVPSPLDDETEKYVFETMACGFAVHKAIGPGYGEKVYRNAFCVELLERQIPFESEKSFVVKYRDRRVHEAQVLAYLKASRLPVALLMNFGGATLKEGLRRIVL